MYAFEIYENKNNLIMLILLLSFVRVDINN